MSDNYVDIINAGTMRNSVSHYSGNIELTKSESAALDFLAGTKVGSILDIGVGAGRTVAALRNISDEYIGVDYVNEMIVECKKKVSGG